MILKFDIFFYMSDILRKIEDPTYPFDEIVSDPRFTKVYQLNKQIFNQLNKYLQPHYMELLNHSLSPRNTTLELNCYEIIICGEKTLMEPIIKSSEFQIRANEIINNQNSTSYLIGRLSHIMLSSFIVLPELSIQNFSFIFKLLPFHYDSNVRDLFSKILSIEGCFSDVQKWLLKIGFIDQLIIELKTIDFDHFSNEKTLYFDITFEKSSALYYFLRKCLLSSVFESRLLCEDVIEFLLKTFPNPPLYVENARWETILAFTNNKTSKMLLPVVSVAVEMVHKEMESLPMYVVFAIRMISKMMNYSPKAADIVFESRIQIDIMNLVSKFSSCTGLVKSFYCFIEASLKYPKEFAPVMLPVLLPFLLGYSRSGVSKSLVPFFMSILEMIDEAAQKNKNIKKAILAEEGCCEFINCEYIQYRKIFYGRYGDDVELTTQDEPEQKSTIEYKITDTIHKYF